MHKIVKYLFQAGTPRKKIKKRHSQDSIHSTCVVLGTSTGSLLVYSIAKGDLECKINSETSQRIGCVSWCEGNAVFAGAENLILRFDLETRAVKR